MVRLRQKAFLTAFRMIPYAGETLAMSKDRLILLVLCPLLLLSGCGKKQAAIKQTAKSHKIVFVSKVVGIPYFNACERGMKKAAADLGIDAEYLGPTKGGDVIGQINIIEDQIARKVDAIVISPNDDKAVGPVIEKAMNAGIKVFTWDSDAPKSKRIFYVCAADDVQIGVDIADALARDMGGRGKVAIMTGGLGALNLNLHVEGVRKGLKKYPGIKVVGPLLVNNDQPQQAMSAVSSMLQAHPDIGGLACINSPGPPGAARALIQAGRAGKVKVWGLSLPSENREYIKMGVVNGLILWDPAKLTYLTAKLVNDYLDGKKPVDGMQVPGIGRLQVRPDGVIIMPGVTITKQNVDQFDF